MNVALDRGENYIASVGAFAARHLFFYLLKRGGSAFRTHEKLGKVCALFFEAFSHLSESGHDAVVDYFKRRFRFKKRERRRDGTVAHSVYDCVFEIGGFP